MILTLLIISKLAHQYPGGKVLFEGLHSTVIPDLIGNPFIIPMVSFPVVQRYGFSRGDKQGMLIAERF
jgi:hypothetical protein